MTQETVESVVAKALAGRPAADWTGAEARLLAHALHPAGGRLRSANPRPTAEDREVLAICRGLFGALGIEVPAALRALRDRLPEPGAAERAAADRVRARLLEAVRRRDPLAWGDAA